MYELRLPAELQEIAEKGYVAAEDVLKLRRHIYADGIVSPHDANAIFWLNESCPNGDPEWADFFVEALTDHMVEQQNPPGYLDEGNADFLARRILRDGKVSSLTELALLVSIIEKATFVPESLVLMVMDEVKRAVLEGEGLLRGGKKLTRGAIVAAEVDLLKRVIYGLASDDNVFISRAEAELLFDLNDAIVGSESHSEWSRLFVCAIANHVMSARTWQAPTSETAERREVFLDERDGVIGFLGRLAASRLSDTLIALKSSADNAAARQREIAARLAGAEMISHTEAEWLNDRIGRDGVLHANEKALLQFLKAEAPVIHPSLKVLVASAA
ncbi:hypothetical protein MNBD_ALPHA09-1395 [hydrothermal vent metagenome]|uniref:Uncharacterized protein n=1 Tax=hydrothermal vent metagenome TaxID=652676 RepID=A0A3B0T6V3_9ZZZZ